MLRTLFLFFTLQSLCAQPVAEALQKAMEAHRMLVVFHQTDTTEVENDFYFFTFNRNKSSYQYYLSCEKDSDWLIAQGGIHTQTLVFDYEGQLLYRNNCSINDMRFQSLFTYGNVDDFMRQMALVRQMNKYLSDPNISISCVFSLLQELKSIDRDLVYFTPYATPEIIEDAHTYYLSKLKYPEQLQNERLLITPEQLNAHWQRLVESHKADLLPESAYIFFLLWQYQFTNKNLLNRVYGIDSDFNATDYAALQYLFNFYPQITDEKIRHFIRKTTALISVMRRIVHNKSVESRSVQQLFEKAVQEGIFEAKDYLSFLEDFFPVEAIAYFDKNFEVIQQSLKKYTQRFSYNFAVSANNLAFSALTHYHNDKRMLASALHWAETANRIIPNNPVVLDTLEKLLQANGKTKEATKVRKKIERIHRKSTHR
ncbi:hypothetical protein [Capnocytophaga genosp. AHN8471]|uniref:hypothetical protein n=1 Tax=Capnocytophaga genosp. AHN8471 TaxID=327574 RepID=UPI001933B4F9|nr:hypothetical protein [Capnocytophaga genosp. AHN8471]MBM0657982.1 hypothetical protein [Capnocytophaga genosp. AHN8471]